MGELRIPELVESPFREHYRELIRSSVERAEAAQGRRPRAASGERRAARFGSGTRSAVRLIWLAAFSLLVVDLAAFGIHSWTTSIADAGVIVLTLAWFWVCVDDLVASQEPAAHQFDLSD